MICFHGISFDVFWDTDETMRRKCDEFVAFEDPCFSGKVALFRTVGNEPFTAPSLELKKQSLSIHVICLWNGKKLCLNNPRLAERIRF
jgi:hypothetical protein